MAKYYYGSTGMNDNSLSHAEHKYIDKYKNKYGNWQYVYEDVLTAVKNAVQTDAREKKIKDKRRQALTKDMSKNFAAGKSHDFTSKSVVERANKSFRAAEENRKKNAQDKLAQLEKERQAHAGQAIGDDRGTSAAQARDKQNAAKATLLKLAKEREAHSGEVIGDSRYAASSAKRNAANTAASRIAAEKANYENQKNSKKQINDLRSSLNPVVKSQKDKAVSTAKKYMSIRRNLVR